MNIVYFVVLSSSRIRIRLHPLMTNEVSYERRTSVLSTHLLVYFLPISPRLIVTKLSHMLGNEVSLKRD